MTIDCLLLMNYPSLDCSSLVLRLICKHRHLANHYSSLFRIKSPVRTFLKKTQRDLYPLLASMLTNLFSFYRPTLSVLSTLLKPTSLTDLFSRDQVSV